MNLFFNQLINGLHVGSIYALIALGYTMVYGIVKLINFAHGDIIMVGAYTAVITLATLGWSTPAALFSAIVACVVFGVLIERLAYKPLRRSPRISSLITAIGVSMLLQNAALLVFGAQPRPFPTILSMPPLRVHTLQISFNT
ncbi:MAG: branched-chain amino acid ABC transporter permease, partial [Eubacteriales bacterium]|nr:branched-chain amino acid ABC transporter permease [Eubacteriales bacterium]